MNIPISAIQVLNGGDGVIFCNALSKKYDRPKAIKDALDLYDIESHPIKDITKKPDKTKYENVPQGYDENGIPKPPIQKESKVKLNRNGLDIARYIIDQKKTLVTGAGVGVDADDVDSELFKHVKRNWKETKFEYDVGEFFRTLKAETQCAVILMGEPNAGGLDEFRFKYKIASPSRGDTLIPLFDKETEDFIGLQREYEGDEEVKIIDLYYKEENKPPRRKRIIGEVEIEDIELPYKNLPIIYWEQPEGELANVADLIYTYEDEFNNYIDTSRYFADPILYGKGSDWNFPFQTDAGKTMLSKSSDGDLKYVTPDNATEMRELEFRLLKESIFMFSRSVMLDAGSLKGLGSNGLSGEAIERYMTDAYMYATSEQNGEFGKGIQRLLNWLVKEWRSLTNSNDDVNISPKFRKYSLRSEEEKANLYKNLNGGQPLIGWQESVEQAGFAKDLDFLTENKEVE